MNVTILDSTDKSIKINLGEAITTSNPRFTAHYADSTTTDLVEASNDGVMNGVTDVVAADAPAASTRRVVKEISVYNGDTVSHTLNIKFDNAATQTIIWSGTLASGGTFYLSRVLSAGSGSPLTTKGDIYVYGTANTRLGVGTDGKVLVADSTQTTGLVWNEISAFWNNVPGTPTRVSDTQFTITDTSNANKYDLLFKKGVLLKWDEGGTFQVGMVVSSSYGTNTVTVNIVGDSLTAGFTTMKYCSQPAQIKEFIIAGVFPSAATTNLSTTWITTEDNYFISADLNVSTAGSGTGSTVVDINDDGTTKWTTKPTLTTTGTADIDNVADNPSTAVAAVSAITIDVDSVTATTAPTDGYIKIFYMPVSWRYRT